MSDHQPHDTLTDTSLGAMTGPLSYSHDQIGLNRLKRLEPHIPEPTVSKPILDWLAMQERPAMACEIAQAIGVRPYSVTAALQRMALKGVLRRRKQMMTFPNNSRPHLRIQRKVWVYTMAGG